MHGPTPRAATTYDDAALLVQSDNVAGRTSDPAEATIAAISASPRLEVAAKAGALDRMAATQAPRNVRSVIPKSFNLTRSTGDKVWVNANATKHMWEETRRLTFGRTLAEEQRLNGLADAVDNAVYYSVIPVYNLQTGTVPKGLYLNFSSESGTRTAYIPNIP